MVELNFVFLLIKIIILIIMKFLLEYLLRDYYNVIYVDWSILGQGPCYIMAVHNTKQAGKCTAQLVERILEAGTADIHMIGFSLGAHVTNFVATNLHSYKVPRITGKFYLNINFHLFHCFDFIFSISYLQD